MSTDSFAVPLLIRHGFGAAVHRKSPMMLIDPLMFIDDDGEAYLYLGICILGGSKGDAYISKPWMIHRYW